MEGCALWLLLVGCNQDVHCLAQMTQVVNIGSSMMQGSRTLGEQGCGCKQCDGTSRAMAKGQSEYKASASEERASAIWWMWPTDYVLKLLR